MGSWSRIRSFFVLFGVAVLMHYPRWFFILDECSTWLGLQPWSNDFAPTCRWDCAYFVGQSVQLTQPRAPWLPLFPLLARAFRWLLPVLTPQGSVIIASNLLSIAAIMAVILVGDALWKRTGRQPLWQGRPIGAWLLGLALAVFPFTQFFSYGYSEPLFLLLFCAAVIALARGDWRLTALAAGLSAAARLQGTWVCALVGLLFLREQLALKRPLREWLCEAAVISVLLGVPLGLYMVWNRVVCGDFLCFVKMHAQWGRHFDFWAGLRNQLPRYELNRILFYLSLAGAWRFTRRQGAHWKLLGWSCLLMAEIPLFVGGFAVSYSRYVGVNLGLFAFLIEVMVGRLWLYALALLWALPWLNVEVVRWMRITPYHNVGP